MGLGSVLFSRSCDTRQKHVPEFGMLREHSHDHRDAMLHFLGGAVQPSFQFTLMRHE